jgi:hypothetical protein
VRTIERDTQIVGKRGDKNEDNNGH